MEHLEKHPSSVWMCLVTCRLPTSPLGDCIFRLTSFLGSVLMICIKGHDCDLLFIYCVMFYFD